MVSTWSPKITIFRAPGVTEDTTWLATAPLDCEHSKGARHLGGGGGLGETEDKQTYVEYEMDSWVAGDRWMVGFLRLLPQTAHDCPTMSLHQE